MLVVVIQNEFINGTLSLVNKKRDWDADSNLAPKRFCENKTLKICWLTCVKPRIGTLHT